MSEDACTVHCEYNNPRIKKCKNHPNNYVVIVHNVQTGRDELDSTYCRSYQNIKRTYFNTKSFLKVDPIMLWDMDLDEGGKYWEEHFGTPKPFNYDDTIRELLAALDHGDYNAAPTELTQGAPLTIEDINLDHLTRVELTNVGMTGGPRQTDLDIEMVRQIRHPEPTPARFVEYEDDWVDFYDPNDDE